MIVYWTAYAVILVGCAYLGIIFSDSFRKRVRQLEEFEMVIKQMEFDIDFLNTPLARTLKRLSGMSDGVVGDVVGYVCDGLSGTSCVDMQNLWKKALERFENRLNLTLEDKKIILDFSKNLGCGDRTREKNNINAALMRLKVAEDDARIAAAKNIRMYRGLGVLVGIFIVIVLL